MSENSNAKPSPKNQGKNNGLPQMPPGKGAGIPNSGIPPSLNPANLVKDPNLAIFYNWVQKLIQEFPTADVVDSTSDTITIKIRYDDVFRRIYKEIKKTVPDSKVSLKPCDLDSKYGLCMVVKSKVMLLGWEQWGFDKPTEITDENGYTYYVTLESLFKAFDYAWEVTNKGKPISFKFGTRKVTPRGLSDTGLSQIWHYITIYFNQVR